MKLKLLKEQSIGAWLINGFIDFTDWPVSRKSALLYGAATLLHIAGCLYSQFIFDRIAYVRSDLVLPVIWGWAVQVGICFLISLVVARRGLQGNWTLWMNVIPYGLFMVATIALFGFVSTAFAMWFPSVIILISVWYSPRAGIIAAAYGAVLIALYCVLLFTQLMPYAPGLLERSIDAQNDPLWTGYVFSLALTYFAFCFVVVVLLIWTQQVQQRRLRNARREIDHRNRLISKYLPSQLAARIVSGVHDERFKPERSRLTFFSSEIAGLAEASDGLEAEELATLLNEYLSAMGKIADDFGGTVSQFTGDSIQIFFGAPDFSSDVDHALRAVRMSLAMQAKMRELGGAWVERGLQQAFRVRIGINTGHASVGDFGSERRKSYAAIGVQAIIANRLQARCEPGKILLSDTTWGLVNTHFQAQDRGKLKIEGIHYAIQAYLLESDMPLAEQASV